MYLCLYVDDGLVMSLSESAVKRVIGELEGEFEIKKAPMNEFVGMQIYQDRDVKTILFPKITTYTYY